MKGIIEKCASCQKTKYLKKWSGKFTTVIKFQCVIYTFTEDENLFSAQIGDSSKAITTDATFTIWI